MSDLVHVGMEALKLYAESAKSKGGAHTFYYLAMDSAPEDGLLKMSIKLEQDVSAIALIHPSLVGTVQAILLGFDVLDYAQRLRTIDTSLLDWDEVMKMLAEVLHVQEPEGTQTSFEKTSREDGELDKSGGPSEQGPASLPVVTGNLQSRIIWETQQ